MVKMEKNCGEKIRENTGEIKKIFSFLLFLCILAKFPCEAVCGSITKEESKKSFGRTLIEDIKDDINSREWENLAFGTISGIIISLPVSLLDRTVKDKINSETAKKIGEIMSIPGEGLFLVPGIIVGYTLSYLFDDEKTRRAFLRSFINLGTTSAVIQILKFSGRKRPKYSESQYAFSFPGINDSSRSFPSGHAGASSAVYITLGKNACETNLCRIFLFSIPIVVSAGRIMAQDHWLSDTVGGLTIGASFEIF